MSACRRITGPAVQWIMYSRRTFCSRYAAIQYTNSKKYFRLWPI